MKKDRILNNKDFAKAAKRFTVLPKRGIIAGIAAGSIALGGAVGAATYFGIKASQGGSQYTLMVKDNAPGHWVGDKIDLNDLEISKVDKNGKVSEVDKSKVILSKDTLDKEGEESIVITDTESNAKSGLKINVLGEGKVTADMYNEAYDTLSSGFKIFRFDSFKLDYKNNAGDEQQYIYKNRKEQYDYGAGEDRSYYCNNVFKSVYVAAAGEQYEDTTPFTQTYTLPDNLYDYSVKDLFLNYLARDFSSLTFDKINKTYRCEIIRPSETENFECKFNKNLLTEVKADVDSTSYTCAFDYNKEENDPFDDPVDKNFSEIQLGEPSHVSENIYQTIVEVKDESGIVSTPHIDSLKIYCRNSEYKNHVKFKTDESDNTKIYIMLDDYFRAGNQIVIGADCLETSSNDVTLTVE